MIENDTVIKIKTRVEIIEETAAFYNLNNLSNGDDNNSCVYFNETTGNRCAVGRCLKTDSDAQVSEFNEDGARRLFEMLGFNILKDEYRIEDVVFWDKLQSLHDEEGNWNENGLTQHGIQYKNYLLKEYAN